MYSQILYLPIQPSAPPVSCHGPECRSGPSCCKVYSRNGDLTAQVLATCTSFGLGHFPGISLAECGSEGYKPVCCVKLFALIPWP